MQTTGGTDRSTVCSMVSCMFNCGSSLRRCLYTSATNSCMSWPAMPATAPSGSGSATPASAASAAVAATAARSVTTCRNNVRASMRSFSRCKQQRDMHVPHPTKQHSPSSRCAPNLPPSAYPADFPDTYLEVGLATQALQRHQRTLGDDHALEAAALQQRIHASGADTAAATERHPLQGCVGGRQEEERMGVRHRRGCPLAAGGEQPGCRACSA